MKLSGGVEWAVHCCVVLSVADRPVPTTRLAELHGVSRTYLAKHLQQLAKAGLITSTEGRDGGYRLLRPADQLTVLDVVTAIDGNEPAFRCTEIRQNGPLPTPAEACRRPCGVARVMRDAEDAYRDVLRQVTIADLATTVEADSGADVFPIMRAWLSGSSTTAG
ncbi:Rrf2 family transcriptional regulator [Alloalcanivorax gelatiniphagus]